MRTSVIAMAPSKVPNDSATEGRNFRDDGARALRAVFSSHDNWPNLSEVERDEWRCYFERMLEWLHHLGYTPERNPCSMLLEDLTFGAGPPTRKRFSARK
jgi:hypothetical protein